MGTSKEHIKMKILVVGSEGFGNACYKEIKEMTLALIYLKLEEKDIDIAISKAK